MVHDALLATLVPLFAFQGSTFLAQSFTIAMLAVPIVLQVVFVSGLAHVLNRAFGEPHEVAGPSCLIGASNFFELAVAAAISMLGITSGAALATVVGMLVEVSVMLLVVAIVNRTRGWYGFADRRKEATYGCVPDPLLHPCRLVCQCWITTVTSCS